MVMNPTANIILYLEPNEIEVVKAMKEKGIFSIMYGKCTLNFMGGQLQNIVKEEIVWKR